MKYILKKIALIIAIPIIFILLTFINKKFIKSKPIIEEELYVNELSNKINNNDFNDINYDLIKKDFEQIDVILQEQIAGVMDKKKKTVILGIACDIYINKLNELCSILTNKLNDVDFERLTIDIDEFNKNLDFALSDIDNKIDSTIDSKYYRNKYEYEERMNKCHEILETYKGFLIEENN